LREQRRLALGASLLNIICDPGIAVAEIEAARTHADRLSWNRLDDLRSKPKYMF
jgi:hypothetical protein